MIAHSETRHHIVRLITSDLDVGIHPSKQMRLNGPFTILRLQLGQERHTRTFRVAIGSSKDLLHHRSQPTLFKDIQHLLYEGEVIDSTYGIPRWQVLMIAPFELFERQYLYWLLGKIQWSFLHSLNI